MKPLDFQGRQVHLVGIGGAGVGALVPLLQRAGATVSGCDSAQTTALTSLAASGVTVAQGHHPDHVIGVDVVVHTAAVGADHPELVAARAAGIPVLTRGACLVALMAGRRIIAVAGSHGKTSTTWMCAHLLAEAGVDPVVMVGGTVAAIHGGGRAGAGEWFVAETDESDGSFAQVAPEIAIVTNLDHEHLRHYGSFAKLEDAFNAWLRTVPAHGTVIVPAIGLSERVLAGVRARIITCGFGQGLWQGRQLELGADGSHMRVLDYNLDLGLVTVPIPGAHMAQNALFATAAASVVKPGLELAALSRCERVKRRFTVHGTPGGVRVVEDYGHHPTEVRATIAAARLGGGQVHVIFQPHRFTRTADCFAAFTTAFDQAARVVLLPVYGAGETPIAGATAAALAQAIAARRLDGGSVHHADEPAGAVQWLAEDIHSGDTVLILGAGDVHRCVSQALAFFLQRTAEVSSP